MEEISRKCMKKLLYCFLLFISLYLILISALYQIIIYFSNGLHLSIFKFRYFLLFLPLYSTKKYNYILHIITIKYTYHSNNISF